MDAYEYHFQVHNFPSLLYRESRYQAQSSEPLFILCPKLLHSHVLLFGIRFHQISIAHVLVGTASEVAEVLSMYSSILCI